MKQTLLIIGGGNMGGALATRWHAQALATIHVVEPNAAPRAALSARGLTCHAALETAPRDADTLVLAIKPQAYPALEETLRAHIGPRAPLVLSIMAGTPLAALGTLSSRVARVMPNLPALIGESMSVACAPALQKSDRDWVDTLCSAVGKIGWVEEESQLHAVTAISGSGPGYIFAFMEALANAATAKGLPSELIKTLVVQSMLGAARMAESSPLSFATLREQVTSPGGTTAAGLSVLAAADFNSLIEQVITAATDRSKALSA